MIPSIRPASPAQTMPSGHMKMNCPACHSYRPALRDFSPDLRPTRTLLPLLLRAGNANTDVGYLLSPLSDVGAGHTYLRCSTVLPPFSPPALLQSPVHTFLKVPQDPHSDSFPSSEASEPSLEEPWSGSFSSLLYLSFAP